MYYGTAILSSSGFGGQGALTANVVNGVTSVVGRHRRHVAAGHGSAGQPMLIVGLIGTSSSLLVIGLISLLLPEGTARGYLCSCP